MIFILTWVLVFLVVNAIKSNNNRFEKKFLEVGYKEVNNALEESELRLG
ncbi:hypothetical protein [Paenisporosarcina sp. TG-14]|nr:hypothetical protein [Paenisporosarcina sp. TG-14]